MSEPDWDVIVVGAGPAGSTAAFYLAKAGLRVLILEKARRLPRFHIGESLLPLALPVLADMGVKPGGGFAVRKGGMRIHSEMDRKSVRISYGNGLPGELPGYAWQVDRAAFDKELLDRACRCGAEIRLGSRAVRAHETATAVTVNGSFGDLHARYLIDASGQDAFLGKSMACRTLIQGMGKSAIYSHFKGVRSQVAKQAFSQGDSLIMLLPNGAWSWLAPLPGGSLSVGVVYSHAPKGSPDQCFEAFLDASPLLSKMLYGAQLSQPVRRNTDFSFRNRFQGSARMVCIGDAHQYLDPISSSGVSLAMYGARLLCAANSVFMKDQMPLELAAWKAHLAHGYLVYERLIECFYRSGWAQETFFGGRPTERFGRELVSVLAGDLWREDNVWQNQLVAAGS